MFDKAKGISWDKKRLMGKSAEEVLAHIEALGSDCEDDRERAAGWLREHLLIDGKYLPVAGEVAVVLLDALQNEALPDPSLVLRLSVDLVVDDHLNFLSERFVPHRVEALKGNQKKAYKALVGARPWLSEQLSSASPSLRATAAFALGFVGAETGVVEELETALAKEKAQMVVGSLLVALGMASSTEPQLGAYLDSDAPQIAGAAAVGLSLHQAEPNEEVARALCETFRTSFDGLPWANGRLRAYPTNQLWNRGAEYAKCLSPHLTSLYLEFTPEDDADRFTLTDATLLAAFPGGRARAGESLTRSELAVIQRDVLSRVRSLNVNTAMLKNLGLSGVDSLGLLLDPPTELDRVLRVKVSGRDVDMPIWKMLQCSLEDGHELSSTEYFARCLLEQVPESAHYAVLTKMADCPRDIPKPRIDVLLTLLSALGDDARSESAALRDRLAKTTNHYPYQLALVALWPLVTDGKLGVNESFLLRKVAYGGGARKFMPKILAAASAEAIAAAEVDVAKFLPNDA